MKTVRLVAVADLVFDIAISMKILHLQNRLGGPPSNINGNIGNYG